MKKRILALTLTFVLVFGMMLTTEAFGAVSASLSGGKTYIKGDSISMTLTYSGGNFGGVEATLSYDKNILEFVSSSGGTFNPAVGKIVLDAGGSPSLSITFTFKAKNTGSTTVSVVNAQGGTMDGVAFTNGASATVTVKDPPPPTPEKPAKPATKPDTKPATKPSSGTNGRGDFDEENVGVPEEPVEEIDPSVKPEEIEVTVGSKTYVICEDLKDKELPEGFEATKYEYGEYKWSIQVAESESSKHTLILLKDKESGKESWFSLIRKREKWPTPKP